MEKITILRVPPLKNPGFPAICHIGHLGDLESTPEISSDWPTLRTIKKRHFFPYLGNLSLWRQTFYESLYIWPYKKTLSIWYAV